MPFKIPRLVVWAWFALWPFSLQSQNNRCKAKAKSTLSRAPWIPLTLRKTGDFGTGHLGLTKNVYFGLEAWSGLCGYHFPFLLNAPKGGLPDRSLAVFNDIIAQYTATSKRITSTRITAFDPGRKRTAAGYPVEGVRLNELSIRPSGPRAQLFRAATAAGAALEAGVASPLVLAWLLLPLLADAPPPVIN